MAGSTMIDLSGRRFGFLTAIRRDGYVKRNVTWLCRCDCGVEKILSGHKLRGGLVKSCGCMAAEFTRQRATTHGQTGTRLFRIWTGMHTRCSNPRSTGWGYCGSRGIRVCKEWASFGPFKDWALANGYTSKLTIDRKDNDGHYEPGNCRWATRVQQAENTRRGRLPDGRRMAEVAAEHGVSMNAARARIWNGWDKLRACTTPLLRHVRKRQHQPPDR